MVACKENLGRGRRLALQSLDPLNLTLPLLKFIDRAADIFHFVSDARKPHEDQMGCLFDSRVVRSWILSARFRICAGGKRNLGVQPPESGVVFETVECAINHPRKESSDLLQLCHVWEAV